MSSERLTLEEVTYPKPGIEVTLREFSTEPEPGLILPWQYEITTSTGYRATLPGCGIDTHSSDFVNCTKGLGAGLLPTGHTCKGANWRYHCWNFHLPRARAFRDRVASTFTKQLTSSGTSGLIEVRPDGKHYEKRQRHGAAYGTEIIAEALGISVEEYRAELAKARA